MTIPYLDPNILHFPNVKSALKEPNGLLAAGGSLSKDWLLEAYSLGIFPWYEDSQPILWWSPDPRLILIPEHFCGSKSLRKLLRRNDKKFEVQFSTFTITRVITFSTCTIIVSISPRQTPYVLHD